MILQLIFLCSSSTYNSFNSQELEKNFRQRKLSRLPRNLLETSKRGKKLLDNPSFQQTLEYFLKQKGITESYNQLRGKQKICHYVCNEKTSRCTINFLDRSKWTPEQIQYQEYIDGNYTNWLRPLSYIKSNSSEHIDLQVDCFSCRYNTEGSMCQNCKQGYYDENFYDRISKVSKAHNNEVLRLKIDCKECNCHKEGRSDFSCTQYPVYAKGVCPLQEVLRIVAKNKNPGEEGVTNFDLHNDLHYHEDHHGDQDIDTDEHGIDDDDDDETDDGRKEEDQDHHDHDDDDGDHQHDDHQRMGEPSKEPAKTNKTSMSKPKEPEDVTLHHSHSDSHSDSNNLGGIFSLKKHSRYDDIMIQELGKCNCKLGYKGHKCDECNTLEGKTKPSDQLIRHVWQERYKKLSAKLLAKHGIDPEDHSSENSILIRKTLKDSNLREKSLTCVWMVCGFDDKTNLLQDGVSHPTNYPAKLLHYNQTFSYLMRNKYGGREDFYCDRKDRSAICENGNCICDKNRFHGRHCQFRLATGRVYCCKIFMCLMMILRMFILYF